MTEEETNPSVDNEQVTGAQDESSVNPQLANEDQQGAPTDKEINFRKMEEAHNGRLAEKDKYIQMLEGKLVNQQPPKVEEEKAFDSGKEGYETTTFDDLKKFEARIDAKLERANKVTHQATLESRYPGYSTLINKYEKEVPAEIVRAIEKSKDIEAAIVACMRTPGYIRDNAEKNMHPNARKALENAAKPKASSGVGATGKLNKRSQVLNMSRAERVAQANKYARQG